MICLLIRQSDQLFVVKNTYVIIRIVIVITAIIASYTTVFLNNNGYNISSSIGLLLFLIETKRVNYYFQLK